MNGRICHGLCSPFAHGTDRARCWPSASAERPSPSGVCARSFRRTKAHPILYSLLWLRQWLRKGWKVQLLQWKAAAKHGYEQIRPDALTNNRSSNLLGRSMSREN